MTPIPTELRELIERACEEIESMYEPFDKVPVADELRALLATPPADAADMGGQAWEEVLAVVTLGGLFHGGSGPELGDIDIEPNMRALERVQCELVNSSYDAHIELIDRRILAQRDAAIEEWSGTAVQNGMECDRLAEELAQHRQQAGKLVEALSACRSELHAMITAHNVQSEHDGSWLYDYQTVSEADEALADWEKTK